MDQAINNNEQDKIKKVGFDGRLQYFYNLGKLKEELNLAILREDYTSCYKILSLMAAEINDRIIGIEEIRTKLKKLKSFLKPKFMHRFSSYINDLIHDINYEINLKASHLMLPTSEEVNGNDEELDFGGL